MMSKYIKENFYLYLDLFHLLSGNLFFLHLYKNQSTFKKKTTKFSPKLKTPGMQPLFEAMSMKSKSVQLQKLPPLFWILKHLSITFYIQSKINRAMIKLN